MATFALALDDGTFLDDAIGGDAATVAVVVCGCAVVDNRETFDCDTCAFLTAAMLALCILPIEEANCAAIPFDDSGC